KANTEDNDIDGDGIININDNDIDGDGIPNDQDDDIDNDGTANNDDSTPGGTGNQVSGTEGDTNTGSDKNDGTTNTGTDQNTGETRSDDYVSGIGIVAVDTVGYRLTISSSQGTGTVSTREDINLKEVRDVIEDNGIALSTFALADLSIITESDAFVQANRNTRVVITVSYLDESNTKISVLESAATEGLAGPVLTVGDLANGLQLNEELFAGDGFSDFTAMIKDESKSSVSTIVDINFLDAPSQGGTDLDVDFILTAVGKKPL
ncbi:MAG: hypothetical protein JW913_03740, partial [Chitinispirillaceae bacterium]|nr:hypothetical protein [Chitinispirillaceae bacterium]